MAELILNEKPLIITIDDFMDHEDCDAIVEFTKRKLERSKVVNYGEGGRNKIDKYRTSSEHFINETFEPNVFHRNSVAEYFETSKDTFEQSIVIRYKEGQEYLKSKEEQLRYVISMIVQRVVKQFFQDWIYRINQKKDQFYIFNMTMIQKQTKKHFMVVLQ